MANYEMSLLEAALVGYQQLRSEIDTKIAEIRTELKSPGTTRITGTVVGGSSANIPAKPAKKRHRKLSAAGKARIIAASKKRWAAFHKAQAARKTGAKKTKANFAKKSAAPKKSAVKRTSIKRTLPAPSRGAAKKAVARKKAGQTIVMSATVAPVQVPESKG